MDFFEKLSKKTSEVYQGAKEKTAKISEEIKLRNKVSDLKYEIEMNYQEIGKMVVDSVRDGIEVSKEEVLPKCEKISRIKDELDKIEANILALKKIKKCVNCQAELDVNADFCSKCGAAQPKIENVEVKVEDAKQSVNANEVEVTEVRDAEVVENVENTTEFNQASDNGETSQNEENNN